MPQVMCPNCGTTINLEKRKSIDFSLIQKATRTQPRSFTKLLHITKLPRKTLSLRLKEMCKENILVKEQGMYKLNGESEYDNNGGRYSRRYSKIFEDRRFRTGLLLVVLLAASSTSGYALARFLLPADVVQGPMVIGKITMTLVISDVDDLYSWQTFINFNSSELTPIKTIPGDFVGVGYPFFLNATDIGEDNLLLGGTLCGTVPGKSTETPEILATIIFGYCVTDFEEPEISFTQEGFYKTYLIDSTGSFIPILEDTLTLTT